MIQDPLIRILLLPFSLLYGLGISIRDFLYRQKVLISVKFDLPVISVGNLTVGGAGKTPHIEHLIRLLRPYLNVATLSRGYRRKTQGHQIVEYWSKADQVGDEPLMFKRKYPDVFATVNENRALGIPDLIGQAPETQVVLLDDAFQHRGVSPGLNILLTEFRRPFTRDWLLPSGRLREWKSAYRRADVIVVTKCPDDLHDDERAKMLAEIKPFPHQQVFFSSYRYLKPYYVLNPKFTIDLQEDMSVLMVCAIANSDYLRDWLETKVGTVRVKEYEDHHYFTEDDLTDIEKQFADLKGSKKIILTTEKDAMRLELLRERLLENKLPFMVLPVEVAFHGQDGQGFDKLVKEFMLNFKV
ncbi:MAG: tetraacyldisaccharide 4'-kinase [Saprospiraceae bacterium]|nr:tetraacyldisaccharide 4'-kinase [Saprospiraceae bacterium]MCF8250666.1 tetraacyldisaccharide 4'-kinase [Saprospiraceae bacterium]MCF8280804.1 tetraacyldisaccharide 4'-kinase [Bacteroidales bacterium]MCF8312518.1 tetraacyldisaccharide 4'-kinase [Saprospiraceae bacterium]MCF8440802.1 tetraacyldisaccharide 4'-kinase [Saprospiraceae bacterium]